MSSAKREDDAEELLSQGEKKLQGRASFFKSLFNSGGNAQEEAAELFSRAGNQFKLAKSWRRAGDAFTRAAETYEKCGQDMHSEAGMRYVEAAKMHKNGSDYARAVTSYAAAVNLYKDGTRLQQCARYTKEIAELHEAAGDATKARAAYHEAADYFDMEGAQSNASSMRVKEAAIVAMEGDHAIAAKLYEEVAAAALNSRLLKYGAREHLLRAGLCHCVDDHLGASRAMERYNGLDATFADSREGELLAKVIAAADEGDVEAFTNAVYTYDSISKLDDWKTSILLKIKTSIRESEEDLL